jgi:predicted RNA-binding protein (virulence factor B family)
LLKIGQLNELTVLEACSEGHYLSAEGSDIKVLLPEVYGPKDIAIGEKVEAFLYYEDDDLLVATMEIPNALVGEYALMDVVEVKQFGAFFDWNHDKDLLVPETEQRMPIGRHESHIVRVCIDERTKKLFGTTKINKYILESDFDIDENDKVKIIPVSDEELGFKCIINRKYIGMIYHNEIFQSVVLGEPLDGIVKKIREDGLIDAALQVQGFKNLVNAQDKILAYLQQIGGKSPLHDKSSPDEIRETLNMSKQTFKNTIGILYRAKTIIIKKDGIELGSSIPKEGEKS